MTPTDPRSTDAFDRRRFLALGAGAGIAALAGCSSGPTAGTGGSDGGDGGSGSGPAAESTGGFRLLISDQPSAIGDFDSLVVTLSQARVFRAGDDEDEEDGDGDEEETSTETTTDDSTATDGGTTTETTEETSTEDPTTTTTEETTDEDSTEDDEQEEDAEDGDDEDEGEGGFSVLDLGGQTVDLTTVVGEKATGVFDGELAEGRYTKVELHVTQVDGVVGGDEVDVKLPSEKLQITNNFEVVAGETLSFVFDITVVEKGQGGYNLLPVISESGVAGRDVEVEEVDPDAQGDDDESTGAEGDGGGDGGDGGPPATTPGNGGTEAAEG